jgi:hypothetical protein
MRKETALFLSLLITSCSLDRAASPVSQTPTPEPTPLTAPMPTIEPTKEIMDSQSLMDKASQNIFSLLGTFQSSSNPYINSLQNRLFELQSNNTNQFNFEGTVSVSLPSFDSGENFVPNTSLPINCGFNNSGIFQIIFNTNTYYFDSLIPIEASAAHLDECFNYEDEVLAQYQTFKIDNPDISLTEALKQNPDWEGKAMANAWYYTTQNILIPNQDKMPNGNNIYQLFINLYKTTNGDLNLWRENFFKAAPKDLLNA